MLSTAFLLVPSPGRAFACIYADLVGPLDIRKARRALEQQTPNADVNGGWNDMGGILVEIVGVGFFDRAHGQTGRAPNNLEIHPILSVSFRPGYWPVRGADRLHFWRARPGHAR